MRRLILMAVLAGCGRSDSPSPSPTPAPTREPPQQDNYAPRYAGDPDLVTFPSDGMTLHGFLYRPSGTGPFPAIVYNHGSGQEVGTMQEILKFFVDHGFVVFLPHRRGHDRSGDVAPYMAHLFDTDEEHQDKQKLVNELVAQSDDVIAAVRYVAALPDVDPKRVATIGCSFGGIESVFAAEQGTGLVAAVDFAGAAMAWATEPPLQQRMITAVRNAKVPILFIQAENDFDTTPSKVLSETMKEAGKPMQVHIYPPNGISHRDGHGFCGASFKNDHPKWGDEVLTFLAENMPESPP